MSESCSAPECLERWLAPKSGAGSAGERCSGSSPARLLAAKAAGDAAPGRVSLVLSGSANLLLVQQVSGSLGGRAAYVGLRPLTLGEVHHLEPWAVLAQALAGDWPEEGELPARMPDGAPILLRGHLPALFPRGPREWATWWGRLGRGRSASAMPRRCASFSAGMPWRVVAGAVANRSSLCRGGCSLAGPVEGKRDRESAGRGWRGGVSLARL
jgi:hypothetical protein